MLLLFLHDSSSTVHYCKTLGVYSVVISLSFCCFCLPVSCSLQFGCVCRFECLCLWQTGVPEIWSSLDKTSVWHFFLISSIVPLRTHKCVAMISCETQVQERSKQKISTGERRRREVPSGTEGWKIFKICARFFLFSPVAWKSLSRG